PAALRAFLSAKEAGGPFDHAAYAKCLKQSVAEVVRKQADIGIDVISDGEFGKAISWTQYALFRLGGFEPRPFPPGTPSTLPPPAAPTGRGLPGSIPSSILATSSKA